MKSSLNYLNFLTPPSRSRFTPFLVTTILYKALCTVSTSPINSSQRFPLGSVVCPALPLLLLCQFISKYLLDFTRVYIQNRLLATREMELEPWDFSSKNIEGLPCSFFRARLIYMHINVYFSELANSCMGFVFTSVIYHCFSCFSRPFSALPHAGRFLSISTPRIQTHVQEVVITICDFLSSHSTACIRFFKYFTSTVLEFQLVLSIPMNISRTDSLAWLDSAVQRSSSPRHSSKHQFLRATASFIVQFTHYRPLKITVLTRQVTAAK